MRLGIMQPYFFPYIGYWQLIQAVDCFVLLDDVQYMRHGWINRNRILKPGEGWQYVIVPLAKHAMTSAIREVRVRNGEDWRQRIIGQIDHYKRKAPYFSEMNELIQQLLGAADDDRISHINYSVVKGLCCALGLQRQILLSSEMSLDYRAVGDAGEWALRITEQLGAAQYINPVGGAELFDPAKFAAINAEIEFLKSRPIQYPQRRPVFDPWLSIIDVLMFNGLDGTRRLLDAYELCKENHV